MRENGINPFQTLLYKEVCHVGSFVHICRLMQKLKPDSCDEQKGEEFVERILSPVWLMKQVFVQWIFEYIIV